MRALARTIQALSWIVCGLFAIISTADSAHAQVLSTQIGAVQGQPGTTGSVPITMSGGGGRVAGVQIDILYDSSAFSMANPSCTAASGVPLRRVVRMNG